MPRPARAFLYPARAPKIAPMTPEEIRILRAMTPEQKLRAAEQMYRAALEIKAAALRAHYPDWSEQKVRREVREIFLNGRT